MLTGLKTLSASMSTVVEKAQKYAQQKGLISGYIWENTSN